MMVRVMAGLFLLGASLTSSRSTPYHSYGGYPSTYEATPVSKVDPAAALPPGWEAHVDPSSGNTYFANLATGDTSWEPPVMGYSQFSDRRLEEGNLEDVASSLEGDHIAAWEHEVVGGEDDFSSEAGPEGSSYTNNEALTADEGATEAEAPNQFETIDDSLLAAGIVDAVTDADASQAPGDAPPEGLADASTVDTLAESTWVESSKEAVASTESAGARAPEEAVEQSPREPPAVTDASETATCSSQMEAAEADAVVATTSQAEASTVEGDTAASVGDAGDAPETSTASGNVVEGAWTEQFDSSGQQCSATTGQQHEAHATTEQSSYAYAASTDSNVAARENEVPTNGYMGWGSSSSGGGAWNDGSAPPSTEGAAAGGVGGWSSNSVHESSYGAYYSSTRRSAEVEWQAANAAANAAAEALAEERARASAQADEFARVAQELADTQKELAAARAARTEAEDAMATSEAARSVVEAQKRELEQDLDAEQCAADEAEAKLADFLKKAAADEEARLAEEAAADEALASGKGRGLDPVARAEASLRLAKKEAATLREELKAAAKAGLRQGQAAERLHKSLAKKLVKANKALAMVNAEKAREAERRARLPKSSLLWGLRLWGNSGIEEASELQALEAKQNATALLLEQASNNASNFADTVAQQAAALSEARTAAANAESNATSTRAALESLQSDEQVRAVQRAAEASAWSEKRQQMEEALNEAKSNLTRLAEEMEVLECAAQNKNQATEAKCRELTVEVDSLRAAVAAAEAAAQEAATAAANTAAAAQSAQEASSAEVLSASVAAKTAAALAAEMTQRAEDAERAVSEARAEAAAAVARAEAAERTSAEATAALASERQQAARVKEEAEASVLAAAAEASRKAKLAKEAIEKASADAKSSAAAAAAATAQAEQEKAAAEVARQEKEAAAAAAEEAASARESALQAVTEIEAAVAAKAMEEDLESTDDETFEQAMPPASSTSTSCSSGLQERSRELGAPTSFHSASSYTPLPPDVLYQGWFEKANRLSEATRPFQRRLAVTWPFAKVGAALLSVPPPHSQYAWRYLVVSPARGVEVWTPPVEARSKVASSAFPGRFLRVATSRHARACGGNAAALAARLREAGFELKATIAPQALQSAALVAPPPPLEDDEIVTGGVAAAAATTAVASRSTTTTSAEVSSSITSRSSRSSVTTVSSSGEPDAVSSPVEAPAATEWLLATAERTWRFRTPAAPGAAARAVSAVQAVAADRRAAERAALQVARAKARSLPPPPPARTAHSNRQQAGTPSLGSPSSSPMREMPEAKTPPPPPPPPASGLQASARGPF